MIFVANLRQTYQSQSWRIDLSILDWIVVS